MEEINFNIIKCIRTWKRSFNGILMCNIQNHVESLRVLLHIIDIIDMVFYRFSYK